MKVQFKQEFEKGELFHKWKDMYGHNDYLSKWAGDRLNMVLRLMDRYGAGEKVSVLEIGVGSGILLQEMSRRGYRVYGADFSIEMVQKVSLKFSESDGAPAQRLFVADVECLPIQRDRFDLVTCIGVLEYLSTDGTALAELYRILRPKGCLILAVASYHRLGNLFNLVKSKILRLKKNKVETTFTQKESSLKDQVRMVKPLALKADAKKAGFVVEDFRCFGGRLWGRYLPMRIYLPGFFYIGDHCLLVLRKPSNAV